jgi:hypothetical protein
MVAACREKTDSRRIDKTAATVKVCFNDRAGCRPRSAPKESRNLGFACFRYCRFRRCRRRLWSIKLNGPPIRGRAGASMAVARPAGRLAALAFVSQESVVMAPYPQHLADFVGGSTRCWAAQRARRISYGTINEIGKF